MSRTLFPSRLLPDTNFEGGWKRRNFLDLEELSAEQIEAEMNALRAGIARCWPNNADAWALERVRRLRVALTARRRAA